MRTVDDGKLIEIATRCGAHGTAVIDVRDITFRREFRDACERNTCGKYGLTWMCPPAVGDIDDLIARASAYRRAFVFQSVGLLDDSFDIEGMEAAARKHNELLQSIFSIMETCTDDFLKLGAGACMVCRETCAKSLGKPCRFPEKAIASMEAYGIAVSELAELCGMKYVNGVNTVTYFGAIFYN
jgi:predicted metal-binding protein